MIVISKLASDYPKAYLSSARMDSSVGWTSASDTKVPGFECHEKNSDENVSTMYTHINIVRDIEGRLVVLPFTCIRLLLEP